MNEYEKLMTLYTAYRYLVSNDDIQSNDFIFYDGAYSDSGYDDYSDYGGDDD